jgi:putative pyruvate formate lyase activating enzyme
VDIYMPDFKYWDPERSLRFLNARDYPDVARSVLREMHRQVGELELDERGVARRGLLIRHLVMPDALDDTRRIMEFIAGELSPRTYVNVMAQYHPRGKAERHPELNRYLSHEEYIHALELARDAGLVNLDE